MCRTGDAQCRRETPSTRVPARVASRLAGSEVDANRPRAGHCGIVADVTIDDDHAGLLRDTEQRRLRALVAADLPVARALHADDYQLINPAGVTLSKQEYLEGIATGQLDYRVFDAMSDIAVLMGGDLACLRYQARIDIRFNDGSDSGVFWHTDVYQLRRQGWLAVWSQATRISV
jgi:hypothetical protein